MEHDAVLAEMQALLASLKSTLAAEEGGEASRDSEPAPASSSSSSANQSRQLPCDLLPDCRVLRRFVLMV